MLHKIIFKLGTFVRNREIFSSYKLLKKTESWDINKLEEFQYSQCKDLLEWTYNNSVYYRRKFEEHDIKPNDFKSLADIKKFPIISKEELLEFNKEIHTKKLSEKVFFSETSGSSGQSLKFYRNATWDARHRAAIFRGYSWFNVKPWERNGYFWGYNINPTRRRKVALMDALVNRFRIFSYKTEDIRSFARKLIKASYVEGYSSMIYEVAKIINKERLNSNIKLKMVKGTSEKIYDSYQEEVKKAFGIKMVSEYGAAEAGIIAFECPEGNMHITMENVIVEESNGEILVTNLLSKSFPIIRYSLGDYITISSKTNCKCGMQHKIIESVLGRVGKQVVGTEHVYPSLTFYYVFKNLAIEQNLILNYQIIQKVAGELEVLIEQKLNRDDRELLLGEFYKYFGDDIKVNLEDEKAIKAVNGKLRDFISEIDN
ncbi:phenylacetate--CoA ligase family protein [Cytobacillus firmus]|uniref:phenylacetate--CoA ligase family protein n=1 Tax=Cytobacillus firmus TaxID=1399 RepID=UPI0024956674|nr:hypothetical protein [Cytobacillus firmus]